MKINFGRLLYCVGLVFLAMMLGGYYNNAGVSGWYQGLTHPFGTPPDMVFPIMWAILYALMALAFYLSLEREDNDKDRARLNGWFIGLLFLHIVWTYAFFYMGYLGIALAVLLIIDFLSYRIMMEFWKVSQASAWMFFPYFVWILFATYLNAAFINLNGYIIAVE